MVVLVIVLALIFSCVRALPTISCPSNATMGMTVQLQIDVGTDQAQARLTGSAFFIDYSAPPDYIQIINITGLRVLSISDFRSEQVFLQVVGSPTNCSIVFQSSQPHFFWERNTFPADPDVNLSPPRRPLVAADRSGNSFTVFFNGSLAYLSKYSIDSTLGWSVVLPLVPRQVACQRDRVVVTFLTQVVVYSSNNGSFLLDISNFSTQPNIAASDLSDDQAFIHVAGAFSNWTYRGVNYPNALLAKFSLDGDVIWVVQESRGNAQALAISVGSGLQIAIQGAIQGVITINSVDYVYAGTSPDHFYMMLFSNGSVCWYFTSNERPSNNVDGRKTLINSFGYVINLVGSIEDNGSWNWNIVTFEPDGTLLQDTLFYLPDDPGRYGVDFVTLPNEHGILLCLWHGNVVAGYVHPDGQQIVYWDSGPFRGHLMRFGINFTISWETTLETDRTSKIYSCAADNTGKIFVVGSYVGWTQFGQLDLVSGPTEVEWTQYLTVLSHHQAFPISSLVLATGNEDSFILLPFELDNSSAFNDFSVRIESFPLRGTLHDAVGSNPISGFKPSVNPPIYFKPASNQFSASGAVFDSFTYKIYASGLLSLEAQTLKLVVQQINDPPSAISQNITLLENQQALIVLAASQTWGEEDVLTMFLISTCATGKGHLFSTSDLQNALEPPIMLSDAAVFYKPTRFTHGTDLCQFSFLAFDGSLNSSLAIVSVSITHVNNPPEAFDTNLMEASSNDELTIALSASDIDGDNVTLVVTLLPSVGQLLQFRTREQVKENDVVTDSQGRLLFQPQNMTPLGKPFAEFTFFARDYSFEGNPGVASVSYYSVCEAGTEQGPDGIHCVPCPRGWGKSEETSLTRCTPCPVGFFAQGTCQLCPVGTVCDAKGVDVTAMQLQKGYWRDSKVSVEILSCPQPQLCLGGVSGCAEFRTGAFCGQCVADYTPVGTECAPCSVNVAIVVVIALVLLLLVGLAAYWLQRKSRKSDSSAVGILFFWLQVCSMLLRTTANKVNVESYSEWLDVSNLQITAPLRSVCAVPSAQEGIFLLRLLVPFGWAVLLLLVVKIWSHWGRPTLKLLYPKLLLLFFTVGYAGFSQNVLLYFQCVHRGSYYVLYSEPGVDCGSESYRGILALFCVAFIVVPAPLVFLLFFVKNRSLVEGNNEFCVRWDAFLSPYHTRTFWWGSYALCRRTLLVIHDVAFADLSEKLIAFGLSNLLFVFLHHYFKPLRDPVLNKLESVTLYLILILNLVLGCKPDTVAWVVFPLVLVPLVTIVIWLVHHFRGAMSQSVRQLMSAQKSIDETEPSHSAKTELAKI